MSRLSQHHPFISDPSDLWSSTDIHSSVIDRGSSSRQPDLSSWWTPHLHAWLPPGGPPPVWWIWMDFSSPPTMTPCPPWPQSLDIWCVFLWHDAGATPDWLLFSYGSLHETEAVAWKSLPHFLQHTQNTSLCLSSLLGYPDFIPSVLTKSYSFLKKNQSINQTVPPSKPPDWVCGPISRFLQTFPVWFNPSASLEGPTSFSVKNLSTGIQSFSSCFCRTSANSCGGPS